MREKLLTNVRTIMESNTVSRQEKLELLVLLDNLRTSLPLSEIDFTYALHGLILKYTNQLFRK